MLNTYHRSFVETRDCDAKRYRTGYSRWITLLRSEQKKSRKRFLMFKLCNDFREFPMIGNYDSKITSSFILFQFTFKLMIFSRASKTARVQIVSKTRKSIGWISVAIKWSVSVARLNHRFTLESSVIKLENAKDAAQHSPSSVLATGCLPISAYISLNDAKSGETVIQPQY